MSGPDGCWVNGEASATVPASERGLHYGDGLFETIACVDGRPRLLELHLERLATGCRRLGLAPPDVPALRAELATRCAGLPRAVLKLLVTRGPAGARGYNPAGCLEPTRLLLRYPWPAADPALASEGVRVRTAALRLGENPALAGITHCTRLEQVLARAEWTDPDIFDALLYSRTGPLISGTMTNVFIVHEGRLITPRVDRCGVAGVMRAAVLGAARAAGTATAERTVDEEQLRAADEIFLTNALIGIFPVREIDGRPLARGPLTGALQARLADLLAGGQGSGGPGAWGG